MTRISRRPPRRYTRRSFLVDDGAIRLSASGIGPGGCRMELLYNHGDLVNQLHRAEPHDGY
jgi:hypothetical protein